MTEILTSNEHHAYPVVNSQKIVVGLIPRNFIIKILMNKSFYPRKNVSREKYDDIFRYKLSNDIKPSKA